MSTLTGLSASTAPLLEIKDLHVHFDVYGGTLKVLDGVNFTVHSGEKVGLVGETGCGKTTTMKSILRILPTPPARIPGGEIYFKGPDGRSQSSLYHRPATGSSG
jgi:peptide/nickel transport system ATP-binding protein